MGTSPNHRLSRPRPHSRAALSVRGKAAGIGSGGTVPCAWLSWVSQSQSLLLTLSWGCSALLLPGELHLLPAQPRLEPRLPPSPAPPRRARRGGVPELWEGSRWLFLQEFTGRKQIVPSRGSFPVRGFGSSRSTRPQEQVLHGSCRVAASTSAPSLALPPLPLRPAARSRGQPEPAPRRAKGSSARRQRPGRELCLAPPPLREGPACQEGL